MIIEFWCRPSRWWETCVPFPDTGYYYKLLVPGLAGPHLAADVIDGGAKDNVAFMAPIAGFTSQLWRFVAAGDGTFRLSTLSRGPAFCAEAVDDGPNSGEVRLTRGASPATAWFVEPIDGPGLPLLPGVVPFMRAAYARLWTQLRGPGWSLDLASGKKALMPTLSRSSDCPGQAWLLACTEARTG
jgi:hypothetical protein